MESHLPDSCLITLISKCHLYVRNQTLGALAGPPLRRHASSQAQVRARRLSGLAPRRAKNRVYQVTSIISRTRGKPRAKLGTQQRSPGRHATLYLTLHFRGASASPLLWRLLRGNRHYRLMTPEFSLSLHSPLFVPPIDFFFSY